MGQSKHQVRTVCLLAALAAAMFCMNVHADICYIDGNTRYQMIDGFGFSTAWCGQLPAAKNNALYGTLGMSLLRVRIPEDGNWANETANSAAAHAAGAKVFGSPWSPPSTMTSDNYLLPSHYGDYVDWLNSAVSSMGLDYVSIQNEPDNSGVWCRWTPEQIQTFIRDYGSNITAPVIMPEDSAFKDSFSDPVINDPIAVNNFAILGGHIYTPRGPFIHTNALDHGKRVWMTEHYISETMYDMTNCIAIAKEISDCMNSWMSAYVWWWVRENSGIQLASNDGIIYKNGYTMGQFAKWVRPGKQRIASTYNPTSGVYVTAYRNGGWVIVAVNTSSSAVDQPFVLSGSGAPTQFKAYRTSASENMADVGTYNVFGGSFMNRLPAQSVTTFVQSYGSGVTFYQNTNYGGAASQSLDVGSYTISQLAAKGMPNDWASSVRIPDGYAVTMYQHDNFSGTSWTLTGDMPNFEDFGANDQVSSVVVEKVLDGVYKIVARHSGKAIDAYNFGTDAGTPLVQWPYWGGTNQMWEVTYIGNGAYTIIGVHSGKCIDVEEWSAFNGAQVRLWNYWGGSDQKFYIIPTDSGYYSISPTHAPEFCLDVAGISQDDGALIHLWTWLGGNNQQWAFQVP